MAKLRRIRGTFNGVDFIMKALTYEDRRIERVLWLETVSEPDEDVDMQEITNEILNRWAEVFKILACSDSEQTK